MSPRARARRATGTTALLVTLAVTAAGCGGKSDHADGATASTPPATTSTPSGTPSATSTWDVEPATGGVMELDHLSATAPDGWVPGEKMVTFQEGRYDPKTGNAVAVNELPATPKPLGEESARSIRTGGFLIDPTYVGDVDINGVQAYHVTGKISRHSWYDEYGGFYDGIAFTIALTFNLDDPPPAERQQLVDSVLATVVWK